MEAEDDFHARGTVEAGSILLKAVEDCADRDAGVEGDRDAQLLDPRRFDIGQDEVALPHLNGADSALVVRTRRPAVLKATHHQHVVILREVFNGRVVVRTHVVHEFEGHAHVV